MERFERLGMVARWQPVHRGHAAVLLGLCDSAAEVVIGIGSSNRRDGRNPFTVEETEEMLRLVLRPHVNFTIVPVPDLGDGPRWRDLVFDTFGALDLFVTANPYVAHLMAEVYTLRHPTKFVAAENKVAVDGSMVRSALARGSGWQALVPPEVADFLLSRRLDQRFRTDFGLRTLADEIEWRQDVLVG